MYYDLVEIVSLLNARFVEETDIIDINPFTVTSSGWMTCINFLGERIYTPDEDGRTCCEEDEDEYTQSIEEYCIQEAKKVVNSLLPILNWS